MDKNRFVELNSDIGRYLTRFLDGMDVINFVETVNNSEQFYSIANTSDYHFIQLIATFRDQKRIWLPRAYVEYYTDMCDIDDENHILISKYYSSLKEPIERLYIHSCFSAEGFLKLCRTYKTSLFKCYSRLIPLNSSCYFSTFQLLDYELYANTIGSQRSLNDHEKMLFKINTYFNTKENQERHSNLLFARTMNEFRKNFAVRFSATMWLNTIDFSEFAIVGGCVLNALCQSPFSDTKEQDVNLVYISTAYGNYEDAVRTTIDKLKKEFWSNSRSEIRVEKIRGTSSFDVHLPYNIRLNFSRKFVGNSTNCLSYILHNFDIDICQVAFISDKIVTTFAFIEALATKSFTLYTLHARSPKHVCKRIQKYCDRGFTFLEPVGFDGDLNSLMQQEETPLYKIDHYQYIDEDGDVQTCTQETTRSTPCNVDTFQLQEIFISMVCPELLVYKQNSQDIDKVISTNKMSI